MITYKYPVKKNTNLRLVAEFHKHSKNDGFVSFKEKIMSTFSRQYVSFME